MNVLATDFHFFCTLSGAVSELTRKNATKKADLTVWLK